MKELIDKGHQNSIERNVLGAIGVDHSVYSDVSRYLKWDMFLNKKYGRIFKMCGELIEDQIQINELNLTHLARKQPEYGVQMMDIVDALNYASPMDGVMYAKAVAEGWIKNQISRITRDAVHASTREATDAFELLSELITKLEGINEGADIGNAPEELKDLLGGVTDYLQKGVDGVSAGVPSGLTELDEMTNGWQDSDLTIIAARPAMGKALSVNELCMTKAGKTRMGDVKVGDEILNANGSTSKVLGVWFQGKRQMYNVTFNDGQTISADGEHYWKVQTRANRKSSNPKKQTSKLTTLDLIDLGVRTGSDNRLNFSVDHCSPVAHSKKKTPIDPYLLGVWLGDGSCGSLKSSKVCITNEEVDVRDKIAEATTEGGCYGGCSKEISFRKSSKMRENLEKLGLLGSLSDTKFIPEDYLYNSIDNRIQLLRGLIDSDGHVVSQINGRAQNQIEYSTTSTRLRDDIITLVRGLGGRASFTSREGRYKLNGVYHKVKDNYRVWIAFSGKDAIVPVSSKKHLAKYSKSDRVIPRFIKSIEVADIEEAVCLTTSAGDSLFLTTDYCVTHNSALATTIVKNASHAGFPCAIFSLEMSKFQVVCRIVAEDVQLFVQDLVQRKLTSAQMLWFKEAIESIRHLPITIDDNSDITIDQLRVRARELKRKKGIKLLVVDYLQLIDGDGTKGNREQEIARISRGLKKIAKELKIPVIALAQLSRAVEQRDNKRPMMSDLRESGGIEQDADAIFFLYRPEYYAKLAGEECPPEFRGVCQLITGKFRNGDSSDILLKFVGEYSSFRDRDDLNVKLN